MEGGNVENIYHWGKSERGGSFFPQFVVIEWRDSSSQLSSKKINEKPYFNQKSLSHASSLTNWLSISSTFNEKLFLHESVLSSFSVLTICVCIFLAKGYWWKRCLCNFGEIDYTRSASHFPEVFFWIKMLKTPFNNVLELMWHKFLI